MPAFRKFERDAIRLMASGHISGPLLDEVLAAQSSDRYEYTGCGYYLTVKNSSLPAKGQCLADPPVAGIAGEIQAGFVVYLGDNALMLECHTWGALDVPENFRDLDVQIISPPHGYADLRVAT